MGYKLKKEYKGSPMKGVTLVKDGKGGWVNKKFVGTNMEWRFPHLQHPEEYFINKPDFWDKTED